MKGFYLLFLKIDKGSVIRIGALGEIHFHKGYYVYVGSAMGGEKRVFRHFSRKKHLRWHIDYLLNTAEIVGILFLKGREGDEVRIARRLSRMFQGVKGFGAGDSPIKSHLFYMGADSHIPLNKVLGGVYID